MGKVINTDSCENCTNFNEFDEEAIKIAKEYGENLKEWGECIYQGTKFHKKSLCKQHTKK